MKTTTAYWPISLFGRGVSGGKDSNVLAPLTHLWQGLLTRLDVSDEPRVWPTHNTTGPTTWNAYDPLSGQAIYRVSEAELRTWLEDLHYQDQRIARDRQMQMKLLWTH